MRTQWTAIGLAVAALFALSAQHQAQADTTASLLDTLLANHTITQAQYDQMKTRQATDQAAAPAANPASVFPNVRINGKVQYDVPLFAESNYKGAQLGTSPVLRRGFINVNGFLDRDWAYRMEFGVQTGAFSVSNAWMSYRGIDNTALTFGNQNVSFGMDNLTADENRVFNEQSLASQSFVPGKIIGLVAATHGSMWSGSAELGNGATATTAPAAGVTTNWGGFGRFTVFPINNSGMVLEGGLSAMALNAGSAHTAPKAITSVPEENVTATSFISSAPITAAGGAPASLNGQVGGGLETGFEMGPFLATGEWFGSQFSHNAAALPGSSKAYFTGWYAQVSYVLTGESRPFDSGSSTFGGITPAHPLGKGGAGAFEIGLRYSSVNDQDMGATLGTAPTLAQRAAVTTAAAAAAPAEGKQSDWTAGLNWYPVKGIRETVDWTHVNAIKSPSIFTNGVKADIVEWRTQLVF